MSIEKPSEALKLKRKMRRHHVTTSIRMRVELLHAIQSLADENMSANDIMNQILIWGVKAQGKDLQLGDEE